MAITYSENGKKKVRKGNKIATDITPRNLKNLNKRVNDDDFTGGANLDKRIEEQRSCLLYTSDAADE